MRDGFANHVAQELRSNLRDGKKRKSTDNNFQMPGLMRGKVLLGRLWLGYLYGAFATLVNTS